MATKLPGVTLCSIHFPPFSIAALQHVHSCPLGRLYTGHPCNHCEYNSVQEHWTDGSLQYLNDRAVMASDTGIWYYRDKNTRVFLDHMTLKFTSIFLFTEGQKFFGDMSSQIYEWGTEIQLQTSRKGQVGVLQSQKQLGNTKDMIIFTTIFRVLDWFS